MVRVLVERKRLIDMVRCVLDTGRHIQQMRDAHGAGYDFIYLVLEGNHRAGPDGRVETRMGGRWQPMSRITQGRLKGVVPDVEFRRLDNYLNQLELYLGVFTKTSRDVADTARKVLDLYYLFQKEPDAHVSLRMLHKLRPDTPEGYSEMLEEPSLLRRVANQLPGVGWKRSKAFEDEFANLQDLAGALAMGNAQRLLGVRGVGKGIVGKILEESGGG